MAAFLVSRPKQCKAGLDCQEQIMWIQQHFLSGCVVVLGMEVVVVEEMQCLSEDVIKES